MPPPAAAPPSGPGSPWRPAAGPLAVALALTVGALALGWQALVHPTAAPEEPARPAARSAPAASVAAVAVAPGTPAAMPSSAPLAAAPAAVPPTSIPSAAATAADAGGDPTPDIRVFANPGEAPTMAEVIARLQQAGERGGLAAFPPPGTKPLKIGLAVPEDFVLPEGYVRHHQVTDDGRPVEAVLMFAPDRTFVDADGHALAIPADRIVPPRWAPPGLPIRPIAIPPPAPAEPGR